MGQKVNPVGFRLGVMRNWHSVWYAGDSYADYLHQDLKIRKIVSSLLPHVGIAAVNISRLSKKVQVSIAASRPGMVLGKKGADIAKIRDKIVNEVFAGNTSITVKIDVEDVKVADSNASLVAWNVAKQVENRVSYKKAMKKAMQAAMKIGAKGVKIAISGRLGGAEIARSEWYKEGRIPLHTLRAEIGYGVASAHTTYGVIGIKVWVYTEFDSYRSAISSAS